MSSALDGEHPRGWSASTALDDRLAFAALVTRVTSPAEHANFRHADGKSAGKRTRRPSSRFTSVRASECPRGQPASTTLDDLGAQGTSACRPRLLLRRSSRMPTLATPEGIFAAAFVERSTTKGPRPANHAPQPAAVRPCSIPFRSRPGHRVSKGRRRVSPGSAQSRSRRQRASAASRNHASPKMQRCAESSWQLRCGQRAPPKGGRRRRRSSRRTSSRGGASRRRHPPTRRCGSAPSPCRRRGRR